MSDPTLAFARAHPIEIPAELWEETGDQGDPRARLLATIQVNGLLLHVEAWAVQEVNADGAVAHTYVDGQPLLDQVCDYDVYYFYRLFSIFAPDERRFLTTEIRGRRYALFAFPFCG